MAAAQAARTLASGSPSPSFSAGRADRACIRDEAALAALPATERAEWRRPWADVDALLARARSAR
jgi:hypothetical protein